MEAPVSQCGIIDFKDKYQDQGHARDTDDFCNSLSPPAVEDGTSVRVSKRLKFIGAFL